MDRSAQIIALLSFLLLSLGTYGQKPVKQGVRASAFYFLQGIEVEADSSKSQYSWMGPNDRAYVLGEDTTMIQEEDLVRKKLPLKDQSDSLLSAPIVTIPDSVAQTIFSVQDSLSTTQAMDSRVIPPALDSIGTSLSDSILVDEQAIHPDSLSMELVTDSTATSISDLILFDEQAILPDTLSMESMTDSLNIPPLIDDSIFMAELPVPAMLETDTIAPSSTDSMTIVKSVVDILMEPSAEPNISDPKKSEVLIKSNLDLFGKQEISQTPLDTLPSRRRLLENPRTESTRITEQRQVTQPIIMPTQTKVIERTVEEPATYTGEYAGLSEAERERQLRLDAENARKVELEKLELVKKSLDLEQQGLTTGQIQLQGTTATDMTEGSQVTSTAVQGSRNILPVPLPVSSTVQPAEKVVIVQRDTMTEKAVEKIGLRLEAISRKDSIENARLKAEMKLGQIRMENRIGRIESKIDTLINAFGQRTTMDRTEFKESSEDMDVFFAVNSHFITQKQRDALGQYLDEASGKGKFKVVLSGYADNSGDASYNKMLVEKRIGAVKKAIEDFGINPTEILINNYGKQKADTSKTYNPSDRKVTIQLFSAEN